MTILFQDYTNRSNSQDFHTAVTDMSDLVVVKILKVKLGLTDDQARARLALGTWVNKNCWESGDGDYGVRMLKEED